MWTETDHTPPSSDHLVEVNKVVGRSTPDVYRKGAFSIHVRTDMYTKATRSNHVSEGHQMGLPSNSDSSPDLKVRPTLGRDTASVITRSNSASISNTSTNSANAHRPYVPR